MQDLWNNSEWPRTKCIGPPYAMRIPVSKARRTIAAFLLAALLAAESRSQPLAGPSGAVPPPQPAEDGIRPEHIWTADYLRLLLGDTESVLTAPARWGQDEWVDAGLSVSAVGVTATFHRAIRDSVQSGRSPGEDRFMKGWQNLGDIYSFGILAGFEAWGELGGDMRAKDAAMDGLTSSIIASGIITNSLKIVVGRERPSTTTATFRFKPFSGNYSFPSGHATQ